MQQTEGKNESDFGNIDSQNRNDNEEESKKVIVVLRMTQKVEHTSVNNVVNPTSHIQPYTLTVRQGITLATMESSILKELDTIHWKLLTF